MSNIDLSFIKVKVYFISNNYRQVRNKAPAVQCTLSYLTTVYRLFPDYSVQAVP